MSIQQFSSLRLDPMATIQLALTHHQDSIYEQAKLILLEREKYICKTKMH